MSVPIRKLTSGVPGLDEVLGGGIPEFSLNLVVGSAGSGKTTLGHQIMFANARPDATALFFTVLGEPPLKMLRYQQQFSFFDAAKVNDSIRFINLGEEAQSDGGLTKVLSRIIEEVDRSSPRIVIVDSFRAMVRRTLAGAAGELEMQDFMQRLALHLTSCEATTFMLGEYSHGDEDSSVFTVADGIVWLTQAVERNSVVRKLQVVKMRGQASLLGLHTVKLSDAGVRVYPRLPNPDRPVVRAEKRDVRRGTGVAGIDEMLGGGIPSGYSVLVVGPSGSGKTTLATQFIREGIAHGERGVIAVFEKRPDEYLTTAPGAAELGELVDAGMLKLLYLRPLDLSVDETMAELAAAVSALGATRVVIDSLMGFELALAPSFREDFRESLYRMVGALVDLGVTVVMTAELVDSYTELRLSPHGISFLTDGIILQRYIELEGRVRKVLAVAKMRGFDHDNALRLYDIGPTGIELGAPLADHTGILVGNPRRVATAVHED